MKTKKMLFGTLGCTVLMFSSMSNVMASTELSKQYTKHEEKVSAKANALDISTTFPDVKFQNQIKKYDTNNDGFLSPDEVNTLKTLTLSDISDLTGIKQLTFLSNLTITKSKITTIDLRGMTSVTTLEYSDNPNLRMLDLRDCNNLKISHHSINGETVWISAGMTNYIGCPAIKEHTGNINIDLKNFVKVNPDGTKKVDLSTVISSTLLKVFKEHKQPGFDASTNVLTIPKDTDISHYQAGKDVNGKPTTWTFYTNAEEIGAPTITGKDMNINKGSDFDPFNPIIGLKATDSIDGDITSKIKVVYNNVDTSNPGIYHVVYEVTNSYGFTSTKTISVTVTEETWPDGAPNGWKDFAGNNLNLIKDPTNSLFGDYVFFSNEQVAIYKKFIGEDSFEPGKYKVTVYAKGATDAAPNLPLKVSLKTSPSSGDSRTLLLANPLSSGEKVEKGYYKVSADVELSDDETTPLITVENYQGGYIAGIFITPVK